MNIGKIARKRNEEENRRIKKEGEILAKNNKDDIKEKVVDFMMTNYSAYFFAVCGKDEVTLMVTSMASEAKGGSMLDCSRELLKIRMNVQAMEGFNAYMKRKLKICFPFSPFYYNFKTKKVEKATDGYY